MLKRSHNVELIKRFAPIPDKLDKTPEATGKLKKTTNYLRHFFLLHNFVKKTF